MKRNLAWITAFAAIACLMPLATAAEKAEEEIPGMLVEQPDGTFLNLQVENNNFSVYLYDKDKKEKQPISFTHGRVRYQPVGRQREDIILNRSSDGLSLRSPQIVKRPYVFQFWMSLFEKGKDDVAFSLNGRFSQPMPGDGGTNSLYDLMGPDGRVPASAPSATVQPTATRR